MIADTVSIPLSDVPPELITILHRVRDELAATFTMCCPHVATGAAGFVCAIHPRGGVRCSTCALDHAERHDAVVELTCDRCREQVEEIFPIVLPVIAAGARIFTTKRTGLLFGIVSVIGVGLCAGCMPAGVAA